MGRRHGAGTAACAALAIVLGGACGPRTLSPTAPGNEAAPDAHADVAAPGTDVGQVPVLEDDGGIRTKSGIPVGDCVEPTAAEQAAAGCPQAEPDQESPCDGPVGLRCPYPIMTSEGYASQDVLTCSPSNLSTPPGAIVWFGSRTTCGKTCQLPPESAIALQATDCESRAVLKCQLDLEGAGWSFSRDATAQDFLDMELAVAVSACAKGDVYDQIIEISVSGGCPRTLTVPTGFDATMVACLKARLERVRWDCALPLVCASYERVLI